VTRQQPLRFISQASNGMSQTDPQLEDGYLRVTNSIAEALARTQMSGYESRILWFLLRKTYGWSKKSDLISLAQFVDGTGIDKTHVANTLKRLAERNIVIKTFTEIGNARLCRYEFNKHYGEWQELPISVTLPKSVMKSLPKSVTTTSRSTTTTTEPSFNGFKKLQRTVATDAKSWARIPSGTYNPDKDEDR
jgi:phage replication O-like protein O